MWPLARPFGPGSREHGLQPCFDEPGGLEHNPCDELTHARDIMDQSLYLTCPVDTRIQVARVQQLASVAAADQMSNIGESRIRLIQDGDDLIGYRIPGDPRGVLQFPEDQIGRSFVL